jgi:gamma-glutamylputrescine oxidase
MDALTANDTIGQYPPSYYAERVKLPPPRPPAAGEITADVAVVGGGYTGLSAALHLARRGYSVVLLEASRVGYGASGRNGGQLGMGQRLQQDELERLLGKDDALMLWALGREAVRLVRTLARHPEVAVPVYPGIVHADHKRAFVRDTHAYVEKLATEYGYDKARPLDREELRALVASPAYFGGALDEGSGHLDPLAFALGLARLVERAGVKIHEGSRVRRIEPGDPAVLRTDRAVVRAPFVVVGCNGYLGTLLPQVARHVAPINSFMVATEELEPETQQALIADNRAVADSRFVVNYFRFSDDHRLLFGGAESYGARFPRDIAARVRPRLLAVFPQLADVRIDFAWGGAIGITRTRMPCFARVAPNVLSLSGYSGHGLGMATMAGQIAAETVAGQAERFDLMGRLPLPVFPGGTALRAPLLALGMLWYTLRDRV